MKKKETAKEREIRNLLSKPVGAKAARGVKGGFLTVSLDNVRVSNVSMSSGGDSPKK